jgi:predicted NBD/HSP70 family sugar kinase
MPSRGATQDEVRRHNLSSVLRQVHVNGPLSRADLTTRLGLNRSTIGDLVGELAAKGLVREQLPSERTGAGRPSPYVWPASDTVQVLAADISFERITVATVGLGGAVTDRIDTVRQPDEAGPAAAVSMIARAARDLRSRRPRPGRLVGVGVSVAGVVRGRDGLVHFAPNLDWYEVPFGRMLVDALIRDVPVRVGNDADVGALAEQTRGAAAGCGNVVYLSGSVGVGGGIIVDGRPLYGVGGYGGEVGHMVVNRRDGALCRCGARGCWETEVGTDALLVRAGHPAGGGRVAVLAVLDEAAAGKPAAVDALESVGTWLGDGIANLINLFNPEVIVFGGILSDVYPATAEIVAKQLASSALAAPLSQVALVVTGLGGDSSLLGAAELAFAPLLQDPITAILAIEPD